MNNNLFNKLKRKPKWKLKQERDELQMEQKLIRQKCGVYSERLNECKDNEIKALKANDGDSITVIDREIDDLQKKISECEKRYKNNAEVLEIYSKVLKNDREGKSSTIGSWIGALTGLVGAGVAVAGLKMSFKSDEEGTLHRKKTLDWIKGLPLIRNFGSKR